MDKIPRVEGDPSNLRSYLEAINRLSWALARMGYKSLRKGGQEEVVASITHGDDCIGIMPTACHARGQKLLSYDGRLRPVEDFQPGETLMGPDSKPRTVLECVRGIGEMFKIVPKKGSPFVVNGDHVLVLACTQEKKTSRWACRTRGGEIVEVTVREYLTWSKWRKHMYKLIRSSGIDFSGEAPALDPYFAGILLGYGSLNRRGSVQITTADAEVVAYCKAAALQYGAEFVMTGRRGAANTYLFRTNSNRWHRAPLQEAIYSAGLMFQVCGTKHIPHAFKLASAKDRYALLAGLLDTGGSLSGYTYDFVSKSEALARDVAFLAGSLGLYADVAPCRKGCQTGVVGNYWRVYISGATERIPCLIRRKQAKAHKAQKDPLRTGFKIEPVGQGEYFGFRLSGDHRYLMDDFTITHNSGKSATYIIPTLCWGWRTLVFSPLIALQKDQVEKLHAVGIAADRINSMNSQTENMNSMNEWQRGELNFLFVAPERLNNDNFVELCKGTPPDFVVVDEAHSASMWAEDFRPAYKKIAGFIETIRPKVVLACTATASPDVEADIRHILGMEDAHRVLFSPKRENLIFTARDNRTWNEVEHILNQEIDGSAIVYCSTVKRCEEGMDILSGKIKGGLEIYTGKLPPGRRETSQNMFMNGTIRCMIATNAFGMGIDKPDIRGIVHFDMPGSVDNWTQEVGRAGRDGLPSKCVLLYGPDSLKTQKFFLDNKNPSPEDILCVWNYLLRVEAELPAGQTSIEQSAKDVAIGCGVFDMKVEAILMILQANGVIERQGLDQPLAKAMLYGTGHVEAKYDKIIQGIHKIGFKHPSDGFHTFDIDSLAAAVGVKAPTLKKHLKDMAMGHYVNYIPPFTARTISLQTHKIDEKMDWKRLKRKRDFEMWRLDKMVEFATKVKDDDRQEYVDDYFKKSISQQLS